MRRAGIVALALAAVAGGWGPAPAATVCVPDASPGGEWRSMGRDLGHGRHQSAEQTIGRLQAATLEPAWTFSANRAAGDVNSEITGYPVVADGCVFVGTSNGWARSGWVFALNADGGDVAWKRPMFFGADPDPNLPPRAGGVYSSVAAENGLVYAYVSRVGAPFVVALDQRDGSPVWISTVDTQPGADAVASPIVFDGMVWVGVSGTAAEGDASQRFDFRGRSVLLDAATGAILASTPSIPDAEWDHGRGNAGAAIWSTISIDSQTKYGYVGTGNPFSYEHESQFANAVLKIDLDRSRQGFGAVVGAYKGDVEEYFADVGEAIACDEDETLSAFLAGFECGHLDLDFGAAPNLFTDARGRKLVGAGQKSGVYHVFDRDTMEPVWKQVVGVPSLVGGIVGTPAFDGTAIYAPHTIAGYLAALDRTTGAHRWVAPVADGVHWGSPVTSANGVLYTVDFKGFLDAYDAGTGAPLLHVPMSLGADTGLDPTITWGGASVARNTVYATVGVGLTSIGPDMPSMPDGFVIAFRPRVL
ncbi:MAG: PQQ-binding-like beta-propeller repeat protein [Actinomycetota bacterium]